MIFVYHNQRSFSHGHAQVARAWFFVIALSLCFCSLGSANDQATAFDAEFDMIELRRLLSDRCFLCHGPDESSRATEFRLDQDSAPAFETGSGRLAVSPRELDQSEIWLRINSTEPHESMPPPESKLELSNAEKELIRRWIESGGEYRSTHWSFEPLPLHVPVPNVFDSAKDESVTSPIDASIEAKLKTLGLTLQKEADRSTLIRRATLALTGMIPTPEEFESFVHDTSPDAYERLIDRLLASHNFGRHTSIAWLDLARYADTHGYQADRYRETWPYRDWVVQAINDNLPFDQFLTWQLAGDLLPDATLEQRLATAFNRLHRQNEEGGSTEEEFRVEYITDRVNTLGTAVFGLTFQCSRCHDHKYDPVSQYEYFALVDLFDNIDESGLTSHYTDSMPGPTLLMALPEEQAQLDQLRQEINRLTHQRADLAVQLENISAAKDWFENVRDKISGYVRQPLDSFPLDTIDSNRSLSNQKRSELAGQAEPGLSAVDIAPSQIKVASSSNFTTTAIQLNGDSSLVFPKVGEFSRVDPFSVILDLKATEKSDRAVVFHHTKSWTDAASRGYELLIEEGHFTFGVIHFWPSNAIRVKVTEPVVLDQWQRVAVTYDGSSQAEGIHVYIDGRLVETEVVRNNLFKDILYERTTVEFRIGARDRDRGFKGGFVSNLQIYDVSLTPFEVAWLANGEIEVEPISSTFETNSIVEFYLQSQDATWAKLTREIHELRRRERDLIQPIREMMVMEEMPIGRPTHLLMRGAYDSPGEVVHSGVPVALKSDVDPPEFQTSNPSNRLELAKWLCHDQHPLTARVAVNRWWQQMFGQGIVASPEDFGFQGQPPTHPQLLDFLARELIRNGWDRKAIFRQIALSRTFRQSSIKSEKILQSDPEGKWLSHFPPRRLTAEQIRDAALLASGLLSDNNGGPPVYPYQPPGLWEEKSGASYPQSQGKGLYRHSLYTIWKRTSPPPSMITFDATEREVCIANRETTVTPLQALVLMNDPQFFEAARELALDTIRQSSSATSSLDEASGNTVSDWIERIFLRLTARLPSEAERSLLGEYYTMQSERFTSPESREFVFVVGDKKVPDEFQTSQVAALTMLASAVMNSDAFAVGR